MTFVTVGGGAVKEQMSNLCFLKASLIICRSFISSQIAGHSDNNVKLLSSILCLTINNNLYIKCILKKQVTLFPPELFRVLQ